MLNLCLDQSRAQHELKNGCNSYIATSLRTKVHMYLENVLLKALMY